VRICRTYIILLCFSYNRAYYLNLKNRLAKLEANNGTTIAKPFYIHFHGVNPDKSEPETTSRGKETRLMRLADESEYDFRRRCKDAMGKRSVIFMAIYA
jgi:hypothetical protein